MKITKLWNRVQGLSDAVTRYPLTVAFLLGAAILNAWDIEQVGNASHKFFLTCIVGSFLATLAQSIYERFCERRVMRYPLYAGAVVLTGIYGWTVRNVEALGIEITLRTYIAILAIYLGIILVPSIKDRLGFNERFFIHFKAFFIALFFSFVLFGGLSLIIGAINQLLFPVDSNLYSHIANVVFVLFAPIYYMSLFPGMSGTDEEEQADNMAECPRFLEILLSYIVIPLTAIFTVILVLYIVRNIMGSFWKDNLLEPMMVSYSITVFVVYLLVSRLTNPFARYFRMILPKVLVPIVVFQTIASIRKIGELGLIHTRYLVILYGIFAIVAGILLSVVPVRKNGILAALLIGFSVLSITPPIDAFTLSRNSQIGLLERTLDENGMRKEGKILQNTELSDLAKEKIVRSVQYILRMEYEDYVPWLPVDQYRNLDYKKTFGFQEYDVNIPEGKYVNLEWNRALPVDIEGYEALFFTNAYISGQTEKNFVVGSFTKGDHTYQVLRSVTREDASIFVRDEDNAVLGSFSFQPVFAKFEQMTVEKGTLSPEEMTFVTENERVKLAIVLQYLNMNRESENIYYGADVLVLVQIKE